MMGESYLIIPGDNSIFMFREFCSLMVKREREKETVEDIKQAFRVFDKVMPYLEQQSANTANCEHPQVKFIFILTLNTRELEIIMDTYFTILRCILLSF